MSINIYSHSTITIHNRIDHALRLFQMQSTHSRIHQLNLSDWEWEFQMGVSYLGDSISDLHYVWEVMGRSFIQKCEDFNWNCSDEPVPKSSEQRDRAIPCMIVSPEDPNSVPVGLALWLAELCDEPTTK